MKFFVLSDLSRQFDGLFSQFWFLRPVFLPFFRRCFRVSLKFSPKNFVCFFSAQAFCAPFPAREAIRIGRRLLSALWAAPAAFLSACRPVQKNQAQ